ncbi:hypothetical protein NDU88_005770 [Pleurodeles waltl]|uniref:Uncharacterized protein n=1 Tax=Pleurodeles waltl TaxID=8319 RepID=A0AAV7NSD4_PLEWA|nr:hypothetical protein NDU88_005770 [Pleurodeles waltl]
MTNPHIPDHDIAPLLQRYGTIAIGPTKVKPWDTKEWTAPRCTAESADKPDTRRADTQGKRCATSVEEKATPTTRAQSLTAAAAGTLAQKTTRPKLDPTANAKVNDLLKLSREESQKIPEPTRRSNPKKKVDCSSGDEEEIEKAWKQVKSQRLREKCRKEKEGREERRRARTKGKQSLPQEEPQLEPLQDEEMERDEVVNQTPQKLVRKRQQQREEDFHTTKKKHITSQTEDQNDGYTTIKTDEENIKDTGGTPGEPNQSIQTVLQELHQQLALIDTTGAPREQTQWTKVPEAGAKIVISDNSEEEGKGKEDQQESQHPQ